MGWNSDREPLDYLQRRLKYYEKRLRLVKRKMANPSDSLIRYLGSRKAVIKRLKEVIKEVELRISQFKDAIKKIQS